MKKLPILAALLLFAGAADAQLALQNPTAPVGSGKTISPSFSKILTQDGPNDETTAIDRSYETAQKKYSQDSYISQTGTDHYAIVDQTDTRANKSGDTGSSAYISQSKSENDAFQTQVLNETSSGTGRNRLEAIQSGKENESRQSQIGGYNNKASVEQSHFASGPSSSGTNNRALQTQTGGHGNSAGIIQQGTNSYAKQTQEGHGNDATIAQGSPGTKNTAIQVQGASSSGNVAQIRQSAYGESASKSYAKQSQNGLNDQADIFQESNGNFAQQDQSGGLGQDSILYNNTSSIHQQNVASAAYTRQQGNSNTAIVYQH